MTNPTKKFITTTGSRLFINLLLARFALGVVALGLLVMLKLPLNSALAQTANAPLVNKLQPIDVIGRGGGLHGVASESERVGPANQPEWTTRRAFAETDIYVIPPGEIEFNQFFKSSHPRLGKPKNSFESEFEFGLPWRTQFDVELNYSLNGGKLTHDSTLLELPHALADWGKIPFNPTIDGGWRVNTGESDSYFFRLLLAREFGKRFHFGVNLSFEKQVGGERETAHELNAALSYVAINSKLTLGIELLVEYETSREIVAGTLERSYSTTVMLGPTVLFKPTQNTHLGFVPLFGLTHDAPVVEAFIIFGIDLGPFWSRRSNSAEAGKDSGGFHPFRRGR